MAQLRDAVSSELVAEGTPEELVLIAENFAGEVLYDGVGEGFDPQSTLDAYYQRIQNLNSVLSDSKTDDKTKHHIEDQIVEAEKAQPDSETIKEVQANIAEARKDVEDA